MACHKCWSHFKSSKTLSTFQPASIGSWRWICRLGHACCDRDWWSLTRSLDFFLDISSSREWSFHNWLRKYGELPGGGLLLLTYRSYSSYSLLWLSQISFVDWWEAMWGNNWLHKWSPGRMYTDAIIQSNDMIPAAWWFVHFYMSEYESYVRINRYNQITTWLCRTVAVHTCPFVMVNGLMPTETRLRALARTEVWRHKKERGLKALTEFLGFVKEITFGPQQVCEEKWCFFLFALKIWVS